MATHNHDHPMRLQRIVLLFSFGFGRLLLSANRITQQIFYKGTSDHGVHDENEIHYQIHTLTKTKMSVSENLIFLNANRTAIRAEDVGHDLHLSDAEIVTF